MLPSHLRRFQNDYPDHDFSLIYDTIRAYYPISKATRSSYTDIASEPGFKKISALINDNFIDKKNYKERWTKLNQTLKRTLKKSIYAFPDLSGPCYSGEVTLQKVKTADFVWTKELRFYISLIGPFFSIQGIDHTNIILPIDMPRGDSHPGNFAATNAVTVSPVFEYKAMFNLLEQELRAYFSGYLFVPYAIGMATIKNISIEDDLREPRMIDTVYEGLFGRVAVHDGLSRGDDHYGFSDWLKPLSTREKELADILSRHIASAPKGTTVHKVWKLKDHNELDTFKLTGNLMANIPLFDVIDLTDEARAITIEKDGRAPGETPYKLADNRIYISDVYWLRIIRLTQDSLTLNVCIDLQIEETSLKGELIEAYYVEMKNIE